MCEEKFDWWIGVHISPTCNIELPPSLRGRKWLQMKKTQAKWVREEIAETAT